MSIFIGTLAGKLELEDVWTSVAAKAETSLTTLGAKAEAVAPKLATIGHGSAAADTQVTALGGAMKYLGTVGQEVTHALQSPIGALGEFREHLEAPAAGIANLARGLLTSLPAAASATVAAFGAVAAVEGLLVEHLFEVAEGAAKTGVAIEEFALKSQISVESASELRFTAKALGKDIDSLGNAMFMMSRRIGEGSANVQQGLKALGFGWKEFADLSPDEQLLKVSDALRALPPDVNKATIVFDIMGRQGREMLPLLLRPMRDLTEQAHELGIAWSEEDVAAAHEFEVATNTLRFELSRFWSSLGKDFIPAFTKMVTTMEHSKLVMEGIPMLAHGVAAGIDAIFQIRPGAAILAAVLERIDHIIGSMPGHADAAAEALNHIREQEHEGQPTPMPSHGVAGGEHGAGAETSAMADAAKVAKLNTDLLAESTVHLSAGITDYIKNALRHHHSTEEIGKALTDAKLAGEEAKPTIEALGRAYTESEQAAKAHKKALDDIAGAAIPLTDAQKAMTSSLLAQGIGHGEIAKAIGVSTLAIDKFAEVERSALTLGVSGSDAAKELDVLRAAWDNLPPSVQGTHRAQQLVLEQYGKLSAGLRSLTPDQEAFVEVMNDAGMANGMFAMKVDDSLSSIEGFGKVVKDTAFDVMLLGQAWETSSTMINQRTGVRFEIPADLLGKAPAFDEIKYINDVIDMQDKLVIAHKRGLDRQLAEQEIAKRKELESFAAIYGAGSDTYKQLEAGVIDYYETVARDTAHQNFIDGLEAMSQAFANFAQVSSGGLAETFKGLAEIISLANIAAKAGDGMRDSFSGLGATMNQIAEGEISITAGAGEMAGGFANLAANAIAAAAAMEQATTAGSRAHRVLGGAATGASIGSSFGPYGTAIGFVAGAIYGAFRTTDADRAISEVGREWGLTISAEMGKAIEGTMKDKFAGMKNNRWLAEVFDIGQMIEDVGWLSADNITKFTEQVRQAFVFLDEGAFKVEDVNHVLEDSFGQLTDYYTSRNALISAGVIDLIHLDDQLGVHSKSVADFVKAQAGIAAAGFNDIGKNFLTLVTGFKTGSEDMKMLLGGIDDALKGVGGEAGGGPHEAPEAHIGTEERARNAAHRGAAGFAPEFIDDLRRKLEELSPIAESTFGALLDGGASFTEALQTMAPGLEQIQRALQATGESASGFLGQLIGWEGIVNANKELFEILNGVDQSLQGLHNSGRLTQESFSALSSIVADSAQQLEGQGVAQADIYAMMQPQLQKIWELEHDFGYEVSDATQKMLDQAEAAGTVGDAHRTVQDQMLQATSDIRDAVEGLAHVFGVQLPKDMQAAADAARDRAADISGEFDGIDPTIDVKYNIPDLHVPKPDPINIRVNYQTPKLPDAGFGGGDYRRAPGDYATGGFVQPIYLSEGGMAQGAGMLGMAFHHAAVNYLANGGAAKEVVYAESGFTPRGTDTVPAMLTPGEVVIPRGVVDALGMTFFNRLITGQFQAPPIHTSLDIDTNTAEQRIALLEQQQDLNIRVMADVSGVTGAMRGMPHDMLLNARATGLDDIAQALRALQVQHGMLALTPALDGDAVNTIEARIHDIEQDRQITVAIHDIDTRHVFDALNRLPHEQQIQAMISLRGLDAVMRDIASVPADSDLRVNARMLGIGDVRHDIASLPAERVVQVPFQPHGMTDVVDRIRDIPSVVRTIADMDPAPVFRGIGTVEDRLRDLEQMHEIQVALDAADVPADIQRILDEFARMRPPQPIHAMVDTRDAIAAIHDVSGQIGDIPTGVRTFVDMDTEPVFLDIGTVEQRMADLEKMRQIRIMLDSTAVPPDVQRIIDEIARIEPPAFHTMVDVQGVTAAIHDIARLPSDRDVLVRAREDGFEYVRDCIARIPEERFVSVPFEPTGVEDVFADIRSIPKDVDISARLKMSAFDMRAWLEAHGVIGGGIAGGLPPPVLHGMGAPASQYLAAGGTVQQPRIANAMPAVAPQAPLYAATGAFVPAISPTSRMPLYAAGGATVPQPTFAPRGTDTVPAMLTPGEFVIPAPIVRTLGTGFLEQLIHGGVDTPPIRSSVEVNTDRAAQAIASIGRVPNVHAHVDLDAAHAFMLLGDVTAPRGVDVDAALHGADAVREGLDRASGDRTVSVMVQSYGLEELYAALQGIPREIPVNVVFGGGPYQEPPVATQPRHPNQPIAGNFATNPSLYPDSGWGFIRPSPAPAPSTGGSISVSGAGGIRTGSGIHTGGSISAGPAFTTPMPTTSAPAPAAPAGLWNPYAPKLQPDGSYRVSAPGSVVPVVASPELQDTFHMATGGLVPNLPPRPAFGSVGTDRVPVLLTPGEYVIPAPVVTAFGPEFFTKLIGAMPAGRASAQGPTESVGASPVTAGPLPQAAGLLGAYGPALSARIGLATAGLLPPAAPQVREAYGWAAPQAMPQAPQAAPATVREDHVRLVPRAHTDGDRAAATVVVRNEFRITSWDGADTKRILAEPQTQDIVADATMSALERGGVRIDTLRRLSKEPRQ